MQREMWIAAAAGQYLSGCADEALTTDMRRARRFKSAAECAAAIQMRAWSSATRDAVKLQPEKLQ